MFLKYFSEHNIRKMCSLYKNKDLLKSHSFYSSEIASNKKYVRKKIVILDFCLNYHFLWINLKS